MVEQRFPRYAAIVAALRADGCEVAPDLPEESNDENVLLGFYARVALRDEPALRRLLEASARAARTAHIIVTFEPSVGWRDIDAATHPGWLSLVWSFMFEPDLDGSKPVPEISLIVEALRAPSGEAAPPAARVAEGGRPTSESSTAPPAAEVDRDVAPLVSAMAAAGVVTVSYQTLFLHSAIWFDLAVPGLAGIQAVTVGAHRINQLGREPGRPRTVLVLWSYSHSDDFDRSRYPGWYGMTLSIRRQKGELHPPDREFMKLAGRAFSGGKSE